MFRLAIGITFACAIGFVIYLVVYLGSFKPVEISEATEGPLRLVYKDHIGAYHKIVPTIEEVEKWAKENNVDCTRSFGEFLDNPDLIDEDRLRSRGGCIVPEFPQNLPTDYKTEEYPERKYVKAVFTGAPSIGPFKVYPKVNDYMAEKGLKPNGNVIEQYVIHSGQEMTTTYYFPVH